VVERGKDKKVMKYLVGYFECGDMGWCAHVHLRSKRLERRFLSSFWCVCVCGSLEGLEQNFDCV
jgi:hypothetical protein